MKIVFWLCLSKLYWQSSEDRRLTLKRISALDRMENGDEERQELAVEVSSEDQDAVELVVENLPQTERNDEEEDQEREDEDADADQGEENEDENEEDDEEKLPAGFRTAVLAEKEEEEERFEFFMSRFFSHVRPIVFFFCESSAMLIILNRLRDKLIVFQNKHTPLELNSVVALFCFNTSRLHHLHTSSDSYQNNWWPSLMRQDQHSLVRGETAIGILNTTVLALPLCQKTNVIYSRLKLWVRLIYLSDKCILIEKVQLF